jgi:hypothetical protein
MYLLNKKEKLIIDKIHIKYNKIYNLYNIFYKTEYIKCIGISIDIKIKKYKKINHLYYINIDDLETLKILYDIEKYIQNFVNLFNIIRYDKKEKYIICNSIDNKNLTNVENITIYMKNIKYKNYNYVPIFYIL